MLRYGLLYAQHSVRPGCVTARLPVAVMQLLRTGHESCRHTSVELGACSPTCHTAPQTGGNTASHAMHAHDNITHLMVVFLPGCSWTSVLTGSCMEVACTKLLPMGLPVLPS